MQSSTRKIWIVDFGSQYTQLITRKSRELGFSSEIVTLETVKESFEKGDHPECLVLSGGPDSLSTDKTDYGFLFEGNLPVLGICYGHQIMASHFGGVVAPGTIAEYGKSQVHLTGENTLGPIPKEFQVWMSHFDHVTQVPKGFKAIMESDNGLIAGMVHENSHLMGLQFHPEVEHSTCGKEILSYF